MKQQIQRLSPHQNAKVIAVLMALSSFVFTTPFFLYLGLTVPGDRGPPWWMFVLTPAMYFVIGYLMVRVGCGLYNFMYQYIGGIEYSAKSDPT
jgi:hypothetical protein